MKPIPKAEINFIVGNMHVGTPYCAVVRDLARRFRQACLRTPWDGKLGMPAMFSRKFRKACYRYAIKVHRANRQLCIDYRL